MARIGIDLDGVCYDFGGSLREYLRRFHDWDEARCPAATRWEFYEDWGLSLQEFIRHCHEGVNAGVIFSHGDPYHGTRRALLSLREAGHTLHVVTDRSFGSSGASEAATRTWLDRHAIPFDALTFSADKTVARVDWMIDDKLANYDALDATGVNVWLLDRPWNQDITRRRRRVTTLHHFVERVNAA